MGFSLGHWRWRVAIAGLLLLSVILPMPAAALIATSLVPAYGVVLSPGTLTLDNYVEVLVRPGVDRAGLRQFELSLLASAILALLAVPLALSLARLPRRAGRVAHGLLELP